jgi:putative aldouronate transport system permease protein
MRVIQNTLSSRYRRQGVLTQVIINAILLAVSLIFLLPLLLVISSSLTDEVTLARTGFSLIPPKISFDAYNFIRMDPGRIVQAYAVTLTTTTVGTSVGLLVMSMLAYALSRQDFGWRRPLSFFVIFTMLFHGGLIPTYILVTQTLHLKDSLLALIMPYLVVPWYVFLLRTYFATLPKELIESAKIDGASEWRVFFQMVIPLSTPALATVGLFCILMYWNDWWLPLLYIDSPDKFPLQYLLYAIQKSAEFLTTGEASALLQTIELPVQSMRMAMAVVAMGPIAIVFLALQRYFVRGMLVGSLKGE